jgi:predicted Fe-Mo cluster-binding NifX family protein
MAYEKEGSTFINKTSYLENCETSACGRALGMAGFGIDVSIASFEEVSNAIAQQEDQKETKAEQKATPRQIEYLAEKYKGENLEKLLKANGIEKLEDLSLSKASDLIAKLKKGEKKG